MTNGREWVMTRVVVDDAVIAGDDPMAVIDPVWWTASFYEDYETYERTLAGFSWPQRLVWAVLWFNSEVCNGGHDQFFSNSTGMVWPEALEGFDAIGRPDLSAILREAVARFPSPPPREREPREDLLDACESNFDDLDDLYFAQEGDIYDALMTYIRAQPEAFYFAGEVLKPPPRAPLP